MTNPTIMDSASGSAFGCSPSTSTSTSDAGPSQSRPYPFSHPVLPSTRVDGENVAKGLKEALVGSSANVYSRQDKQFASASKIYNGAIECHAYALVQPRNADHVSTVVKYCRKHDLQLSVKAGGTGVHGQSVAGHVVLDLVLLNDIAIDLPRSGPTLYDSYQSHTRREANGQEAPPAQRKRSATDAMGGEGDMGDNGRQKMDGTGDIEMLSPTESSTPPSTLWTRSSGSNTTAATSNPSDGGDPSRASSSRTNSDPNVYTRPPRTTYVNPSPTTSSSFPYVPTSFGGTSASATQYQQTFTNPLMAGRQLDLNTNPDAPPYTVITFGTGVHSKQLDKATSESPYGAFHIPTSAFPVGAGQFLLGGFGFLGRKHGLAMDCVIEAEVVLADGRIVWLGTDGHHGDFRDGESADDLWWAIRGAGSSFGIVTRLRSKAYYLPSVYAGNFIFKFSPFTTPSLLRHVRDCIKGAPRSLYTNIIMTAGPPGTPAIVAIQLCFSGSRSEGEMYVQTIGAWTEDKCLFQDFSERSFSRQQLAVEEVLRDGRGRKWYIKSDMLSSLSDEVIEKTCDKFPGVPDGCTWLFEYTGGGAMSDITDSCFPSSHRDSQFTVAALHQWSFNEPKPLDAKCISTAEEWINEVIHPNSAGGPLPCTPDEVPGSYGENFARLQGIKDVFDPTHFIRHAMWPTPPKANGNEQDQNNSGESAPPPSSMAEKSVENASESQTHSNEHTATQNRSSTDPTQNEIILPAGHPSAEIDGHDAQGPSAAAHEAVNGLSQTRLEAIRDTPLTGIKEHKSNVPSENMNLEETVRAAASSC